MRIVDASGDETEAVSLGDLLRVQVLMDDECTFTLCFTIDNISSKLQTIIPFYYIATYGIFLRNMVARSTVDDSEITLIDNMG